MKDASIYKNTKDILKDIFLKKELMKSIKKLSLHENEKLFLSLHSLTYAGIPILKSLAISKEQINSKDAIKKVIKEIEKGESLESALKKSKAFDSFTTSIISAGENSGKIDESFHSLTSYFKTMNMIRKTIQSALYYPVMIFFALICLILYIVFNFVPSLVEIYGANMAYNNSSSFYVISSIMFIREYFLEVNLITISSVVFLFLLLNLAINKGKIKFLKYKIPFIGNVLKKQMINNVIWCFYIMLDSGIPIMKTLDILIDTSYEKVTKEYIKRLKNDLGNGYSLSESFINLNLNDETALYFITLGEETGDLVNKLKLLSEIYTKDITNKYKELAQIIQPLFIGIMTLVVGILMFSVILPLLSYDVFYNL